MNADENWLMVHRGDQHDADYFANYDFSGEGLSLHSGVVSECMKLVELR